jgi:hypothetical protein
MERMKENHMAHMVVDMAQARTVVGSMVYIRVDKVLKENRNNFYFDVISYIFW